MEIAIVIKISSEDGVIAFILKIIAGAVVRGKYESISAAAESGYNNTCEAINIGMIRTMLRLAVICCASCSVLTIEPMPTNMAVYKM